MCVWHTGWLVRLVSGVYVGPVLVEMPGGQLDAGVVADLAFWSQQCGTDFPPAPTDSELGCWRSGPTQRDHPAPRRGWGRTA